MKSKRSQEHFIQDITDAIERIEAYVACMDADDFYADKKTQDATVYCFQIIGEAARNISADFKRRHPEIEWRQINGFRNTLIHEYFGIKIKTVWDTIKKNLPDLKEKIAKIASENKQKKLI